MSSSGHNRNLWRHRNLFAHMYELSVAPIMLHNKRHYAIQISCCGEYNWSMAPTAALLDTSPSQWDHTYHDRAQWGYSCRPTSVIRGVPFSVTLAQRLPVRMARASLALCCSLRLSPVNPSSFFLPQGSDPHLSLKALPLFLSPSSLFFNSVSSSKSLGHLISSWYLLLRGLELTHPKVESLKIMSISFCS